MIEKESTVVVYGTIIDISHQTTKIDDSSTNKYKTTYAAIYEYEVNGQVYILTNNNYTGEIPDIGAKVKIYHDTETGMAVSEESWELS